MNTITVDIKQSEQVLSLYNTLFAFSHIHHNYDSEVEEKLDEFVKFLESKLNRNKLSDLDIVSDEYFERITYDKDTLENLKNNKK